MHTHDDLEKQGIDQLNQAIAGALAQLKMGNKVLALEAYKRSVLNIEESLEERAKRGNRERFLKVLKSSPDTEPDPFDKL